MQVSRELCPLHRPRPALRGYHAAGRREDRLPMRRRLTTIYPLSPRSEGHLMIPEVPRVLELTTGSCHSEKRIPSVMGFTMTLLAEA